MSGHLSPPTRGLQRAPRPLQGRRAEVTLLVKERAETKTLRLLVSSWVIFFCPSTSILQMLSFSLPFSLPPSLLCPLAHLPPPSHPPAPRPCPPPLFTTSREPSTCQVLLVFICSAPSADSHAGAFQGRAAIGEVVSGGPEGRSSGGALVSCAPASDGLCPHSPCPCLGGTCPSQQDLRGPFGAWARKGHLKVGSGRGQLASRQHL